jgi:hypothetical protein
MRATLTVTFLGDHYSFAVAYSFIFLRCFDVYAYLWATVDDHCSPGLLRK